MEQHQCAGLYFAVSHEEVAVRNHIAGHHEEFRRIAESRTVRKLFGEVQGEQLTRTPKGFPCGHPADDLLRMRQFLLYVELPPDTVTTSRLFWRDRFAVPGDGAVEFLNAPLAAKRRRWMRESCSGEAGALLYSLAPRGWTAGRYREILTRRAGVNEAIEKGRRPLPPVAARSSV